MDRTCIKPSHPQPSAAWKTDHYPSCPGSLLLYAGLSGSRVSHNSGSHTINSIIISTDSRTGLHGSFHDLIPCFPPRTLDQLGKAEYPNLPTEGPSQKPGASTPGQQPTWGISSHALPAVTFQQCPPETTCIPSS